MPNDEINQGLGEDEKENSTASPAEETESPKTEKLSELEEYQKLLDAKKGLQDEKDRLKKEIADLRGERRELKVGGQPQTTVATPEEPESLTTQDDWKKHIEKTSEKTVAPVVSEIHQFKETQKQKAIKSFVKRHPEYATSSTDSDEKFNELVITYDRVKSRNDMDADEILEDLEDAWAIKNRSVLYEKERTYKSNRTQAEIETAEIASSGIGSYERNDKVSQDASQSDKKIANEIGMPLERYMKLKKENPDFFK